MNSPTSIAAFKITRAAKEGTLRGEIRKIDTRPGKLAVAIAWLGPRYVFSPKNRLQRLAEPFAERYSLAPRVLKRSAK